MATAAAAANTLARIVFIISAVLHFNPVWPSLVCAESARRLNLVDEASFRRLMSRPPPRVGYYRSLLTVSALPEDAIVAEAWWPSPAHWFSASMTEAAGVRHSSTGGWRHLIDRSINTRLAQAEVSQHGSKASGISVVLDALAISPAQGPQGARNLFSACWFCSRMPAIAGAPQGATDARLDLSHRFDRGDHGHPLVLRPALTHERMTP